jgi:hypothetical protein
VKTKSKPAKKAAKTEATEKVVKAKAAEESLAPNFFQQDDLARLEVCQLRADNAFKQCQIVEAALHKFVAEANESIRKSEQNLAELKKVATEKISQLNALYAELEPKYQVDMKCIQYDPTTGKIHRNPQQ